MAIVAISSVTGGSRVGQSIAAEVEGAGGARSREEEALSLQGRQSPGRGGGLASSSSDGSGRGVDDSCRSGRNRWFHEAISGNIATASGRGGLCYQPPPRHTVWVIAGAQVFWGGGGGSPANSSTHCGPTIPVIAATTLMCCIHARSRHSTRGGWEVCATAPLQGGEGACRQQCQSSWPQHCHRKR
jgi:hypothetical protein